MDVKTTTYQSTKPMSLIRYQVPALSTWSRFDRLSDLRNEVNRLFDFSWPSQTSGFSGSSPAVDVFDDKDSLVVKAELPGLKKEEINLSLHEGVLTLSGERKSEQKSGEGQTFRSERTFGKFERSITLPAAVDSSKVTASYKDGVLTVALPKAEEAKPKQIQVSVS